MMMMTMTAPAAPVSRASAPGAAKTHVVDGRSHRRLHGDYGGNDASSARKDREDTTTSRTGPSRTLSRSLVGCQYQGKGAARHAS
eukprot:scaffold1574_cov373-Prasinococcus_capsulatus_cf.AAC.6